MTNKKYLIGDFFTFLFQVTQQNKQFAYDYQFCVDLLVLFESATPSDPNIIADALLSMLPAPLSKSLNTPLRNACAKLGIIWLQVTISYVLSTTKKSLMQTDTKPKFLALPPVLTMRDISAQLALYFAGNPNVWREVVTGTFELLAHALLDNPTQQNDIVSVAQDFTQHIGESLIAQVNNSSFASQTLNFIQYSISLVGVEQANESLGIFLQ